MRYQYNPETIYVPERYRPAPRPWWCDAAIATLAAILIRLICC
jgi:hypothetical protein